MKTAWLLGVGLAILVPGVHTAQSAQAYRPLAVSPMCIASETEGAATEAKAVKPPRALAMSAMTSASKPSGAPAKVRPPAALAICLAS